MPKYIKIWLHRAKRTPWNLLKIDVCVVTWSNDLSWCCGVSNHWTIQQSHFKVKILLILICSLFSFVNFFIKNSFVLCALDSIINAITISIRLLAWAQMFYFMYKSKIALILNIIRWSCQIVRILLQEKLSTTLTQSKFHWEPVYPLTMMVSRLPKAKSVKKTAG